jgi:branched-chain amino acid aminotransferase
VAEATGANVFFVMNGEIHTPKPDCFLDGITRRTVVDLARARQLKVIERAIMPEEMSKATECFLTGTAAEITPVGEIDRYKFTPGKVTQTLWDDFQAMVRKPS